MLLAIDFCEVFVDEERVAIASVLSFQAAGVNGTEFETRKADRFSGYSDASFGE